VRSLFWQLLGVSMLVVAVAAALARSLLATSLAAGAVGLFLSVVLFRAVTRPLRAVSAMAERLAGGDYAARVAPPSAVAEVASLAESLNRMAASLGALERLRTDLVANVAHELRTPLSTLRGYLEALRDGVTPASPGTVAMLHEEVMRLVRLVEALHELSLLDARTAQARLAPVDLEQVARRALALREAEFAAKGIRVELEAPLSGTVGGDADLLAQALGNLLDNAVRYTPPGGRVTVRIERVDGTARLGVTNSGDGIAPEDLPFIFERFYRAEKSRAREGGGAGIGLAIVKEVARTHGGTVGASSAQGATTVWMTLAG
jgi:signal transduction histidine kinase